jgi:hypothetical protein
MARGSSTEIGPHKRRVRPDAGQTPGSGRRAAEKALADLIRAEEKIKKAACGYTPRFHQKLARVERAVNLA